MLSGLRLAMRMMSRRKGLVAVAAASLALGVAINTSAFGIVNAIWFRPLPFRDGDRLVVLTERNIKSTALALPSLGIFQDWREQSASFEGMEALLPRSFNLGDPRAGTTAPEGVSGAAVTIGAVDFMGLPLVAGRPFLAGDDNPGIRVALIGEGLWRRRFAADPSIVGREVLIDGERTTVAGVLPYRFQFIYGGYQVVIPLREGMAGSARDERKMHVLARLKHGISLEQAQSELSAIAAGIAAAHPSTNQGWNAKVTLYRSFVFRDAAQMYPLLLAAACLLMLIVCANVSNLLLALASSRQKEMALRAALGAGRWRLLRLVLGEGALLALLGGAAGFLAVVWIRDLLVANYQELSDLRVDFRVFAYSLFMTMLAGLVVSLAPAITASRPDVIEALKSGGPTVAHGQNHRLRSILVVVELALALVLLTGTGLLVRTAMNLRHADPGFPTSNLLAGHVVLRGTNYSTPGQKIAFVSQLQDRLAEVGGVESCAASSHIPLLGPGPATRLEIAGSSDPARTVGSASVMPGYVETLRIPLLAGRPIQAGDQEGAEQVAVVNETLSRMLWTSGAASAIGQRIRLDGGPWRRIVGVAADTRAILIQPALPEVMVPFAQTPTEGLTLVFRTNGETSSVADPLRRKMATLDPGLPLSAVSSVDNFIEDYYPRVMGLGIAAFALVATFLAALGLYGVMSFSIEQRRREIGIRMALGAERIEVLRLILTQSLRLALWGVGFGLLGAFAVARVLSGFLFGVKPADPLVFASVSLILLAVAIASSYIPARRASRVDPMTPLRGD